MKKRFVALFLFAILMLSLLPASIPTALAASSRTFKINTDIDWDDVDSEGRLKITWSDSKKWGPYKVTYKCLEGDDKQTTWIASKSVSTRSYKFYELTPGKRYLITVTDKNGLSTSAKIKMPRGDNWKVSRKHLSPVFKVQKAADEYAEPKDAGTLYADTVAKAIKKGRQYSFYWYLQFKQRIPKKYAQTGYFVFTATAPNGYEYTSTVRGTIGWQFSASVGWKRICRNFFTQLYKENGYISSGTYNLSVYFCACRLHSVNFEVY